MKPRLEIRFDKDLRLAFRRRKPAYAPCDNEFLLNHARSGLLLALQALGLPRGSRVGVMALNCHTVMNAVAQAGCRPVFIDVDNNLQLDQEDLQRKSDGLRALIVTHLFGILNDIQAIQQSFPNLIIIEDCAHAFGKPIEGGFGVYSIGQGKMPSLGDGGILLVNDTNFINTAQSLYNALPEYSKWNETKLYLRLQLSSWFNSRMLYGWLSMPLKRWRKPQSGKETIVMKKMSPGVQAMLSLRKDSVKEMIERHRATAQKEIDRLNSNPLVIKTLVGENAFMLPVLCSDVTLLKTQYAQRGVETATHFANSILWAKEFGYQGDCPNTEKLLSELLVIPVY